MADEKCEYGFDYHQRIVRGYLSGPVDFDRLERCVRGIGDMAGHCSARGVVIDVSEAEFDLVEEQFDAVVETMLDCYGEGCLPLSVVSRRGFGQIMEYVRCAVMSGRLVRACLTSAEAVAWIDYCTSVEACCARLAKLSQVHDLISCLDGAQLDRVLAAARVRVAPRRYSHEELLGGAGRGTDPSGRPPAGIASAPPRPPAPASA